MRTKPVLLAAICGALLSGIAHADTTLTFTGQGPNNFDPISGTYGSNQPTTPNIAVGYKTLTTANVLLTPYLDYWTTGYSDLVGVAFASTSSTIAEVDLTPSAGHSVTLRSFDMGAYPANNLVATTLQVTDGTTTIDYAGANGFTVIGIGNHSSFSPNFTSTSTVRIRFGTDFNIGIDNIVFAQDVRTAVPEPGSLALLAGMSVSGAGFLIRRCKRARRAA